MTIIVCVVPANERWVIARLGRHRRVLPPGRHRIVPLLDRVTARIPMDRQVLEWSEHGRPFGVRGRISHRGTHTFEWSEVDGIEDGAVGYVRVAAAGGRRAWILVGDAESIRDLVQRLERARGRSDQSLRPPAMRQRRLTYAVLPLAFAVATFIAASFTRTAA